MNKNRGRTLRHIRGLNLVRMPRAMLLVMALVIAASIQLASPWAAFAQQPFSDLTANEDAFDVVNLPPTATNAQAATMQTAYRSWGFFLGNRSPTPVTNATVSINSGYDPSLFNGVTAFPVTDTQPAVATGQVFSHGPLQSHIPVSFTLGYDSTRTVSPLVIPVGGTQQIVTITMTPIDSRYVSAQNALVFLLVALDSHIPGVSIVSITNPNNLNQGETIQNSVGFGQNVWQLGFPQLNKQYTFSAVLNVPNPFGVPFEFRPVVNMSGARTTLLCEVCPGSTVTVKDTTLDGNVPGSGGATFSVAETSHTWTSGHGDQFGVYYEGTTQVSQVTPVTIDVKPGDGQPAPINPKSQGVIPVAILSTNSFDATTVDPTTVKFGVTGTEASSTQNSFEDVNGDGKLDLVLHFPTQHTGIVCATTTVTLTGQTTTGQAITGTVPIRTVGCH